MGQGTFKGGVGHFFGNIVGALKYKTLGAGGHIFHKVFGGVRCVHWYLFSLKVIASGLYIPALMVYFLSATSTIRQKVHN